MDTYSIVEKALKKISEVVVPDEIHQIEDKAILNNVAYLTNEYITELSENNHCIKKLMDDIASLTKSLDYEKERNKFLKYEVLYNINKRHFGTYMTVLKNRESTEQEWLKFNENFINSIEFSKAVYEWIEKNITT
jgi:hypothetical protein